MYVDLVNSFKEVAKILGCSAMRVRELDRKGVLPAPVKRIGSTCKEWEVKCLESFRDGYILGAGKKLTEELIGRTPVQIQEIEETNSKEEIKERKLRVMRRFCKEFEFGFRGYRFVIEPSGLIQAVYAVKHIKGKRHPERIYIGVRPYHTALTKINSFIRKKGQKK